MNTQRIEILTKEILAHLKQSNKGHCTRVDFLPRDEANAICQQLNQLQPPNGTRTYVLASGNNSGSEAFTITADAAIELRNRKEESLCLLVPTDIMDTTASSLGNSFALIDTSKIYDGLLKQLRARLSPSAQKIVQSVFNQLRGSLKAGKEQRISFISTLLELEQQGKLDQAGLELWRVGLIVNALPATQPAFIDALNKNKDCVRALVYPTKVQTSLTILIQSLLVDDATARKLTQFFRNRSLQNTQNWSRALIAEGLTFEQWRFPAEDRSDITGITIQRFIDSVNKVERYSHLTQPQGPGTNLQAVCGPKSTIRVRWKAEPPNPSNLKSWRVEMLPANTVDDESDPDTLVDLPSREIAANRNDFTIKLDIEVEKPLEVVIRIIPIEISGETALHPETRKPIYDHSDAFFLMPEREGDEDEPENGPVRELRSAVTTIALGRLEQALQTRTTLLQETGPQWSTQEIEYFSLRLDNKRTITVGLSIFLKELEVKTLANSRSGGMFRLVVHEVRQASVNKCQERHLRYGSDERWKSFWNMRETFFKSLRQSNPRHLVEVAAWKPELINAAVRYVQSYQSLVQTLLQSLEQHNDDQPARWKELREVMSLDTLLIGVHEQRMEEALVVLPTHPLRIAWLIGYIQLLSNWEEQILERTKQAVRKDAIDMEALRLLTPVNMPAFAFHDDSSEPFVFFQNLRFYHGVLLPVGIPDPHRRYGELATILGADQDQVAIGSIQPSLLAGHLANFVELHPYINTLVTTLINPDRGDFFAEALKQLVQSKNTAENDDGYEEGQIAAFQVTSYVEDERKSSVQALNRIRQTQLERFSSSGGSYFLPGLSTTVRDIKHLDQDELADSHIAVIADFTRPSLSTYIDDKGSESEFRSFALYGLLCRFVPQLERDAEGLVWRYQILTEQRLKPSEAHPVKAHYSDILLHLYSTLLEAGARLLGGKPGSQLALEVRLDEERRHLLERLHQSANWVVTLDRFFALDYYDSPHIEGLDEMARKYVLDYSPEFSEGLGHRLMITTSWHEEIGSLLRQAMEEHGIAAIESSVSHLLHHLKVISGSLALQALESKTSAAAAVGLGIVAAWLQKKNRLRQSVLVPVDLHPRLFAREVHRALQTGERRCDLALFTLKRNIVEVTFIEVKWRRGRIPFDRLGEDMYLQMHASCLVLQERFFNTERIDGALQRSHLSNVLRFYFERSRRYALFDPEAEHTFLERLNELEKASLEFRHNYEGYIVSLDERAATFKSKEARIHVLTAKDFDTEAFPMLASLSNSQEHILTDLFDEDSATLMDEDDLLKEEVKRRRTGALEHIHISVDDASVQDEQKKNPEKSKEVVITLGKSLQGGECQWQPSVKGSPHLFILGIPGQGKSWTTTRLLIELGRQDVPALVLDFHGQFADSQEPFVQQLHPHVLDVARGLPFSPFECSPNSEEADIIANSLEVAEIFAHVTNLGPIQKDTLYQAMLSAYQAKGFTENTTTQPLEYPTLEEVLEQIKAQSSGHHIEIILARCRGLLEMKLFRPEPGTANLLAQIRDGLVFDLQRVMESLQLAAGAFILRKVYKDMFRWGPTNKLRLAIVLDEAHRLAKDITLPKIMKEGRKFGIVVIVASQELTDFHQGIIGNVGTKVIFRINHPNSRKVAGLLQAPVGVDMARQISQLQVGSAYVQTPEMQNAAKIFMHPLQ